MAEWRESCGVFGIFGCPEAVIAAIESLPAAQTQVKSLQEYASRKPKGQSSKSHTLRPSGSGPFPKAEGSSKAP